MRGIIAFDLFEPATQLTLKNYYSPERVYSAIYYYTSMSVYTQTAYFVGLLSIIILNFKLSKRLKQNGWLFMLIILIYLSLPVEVFRSWLDYNLSIALFEQNLTNFNAIEFKDYFFERFENSFYTMIFSLSLLANLTALIFVIWKPLKIVDKEEINENKTNT
jgi:hypothetical protein